MKRRALVIGTLAAMVLPAMLWAATATYKVDPVHAAVVFRVKHIGVSYTYGRFNDISGVVKFDPADPAATTFDIAIKAESVDTGNEKRDEHLRGPDFFNARQFPLITFKSTKTEKESDVKLKVTGELSLHGIKKVITVDMDITGHGSKPPPFGTRAGFETVFEIKRSEFGMTYGIENGGAGDEIRIVVSLETIKE